jgi:hypothetical protein
LIVPPKLGYREMTAGRSERSSLPGERRIVGMEHEKVKSNERAERLAAALRANLQRRKAQARQLRGKEPEAAEQPGPANNER